MPKRSPSPRTVLWIVGFGVFVAADDLTVVSTMLRPIITDLGIVLPDGLDDAAWIVNAYLIAFVAVMPFMGRLSDILGRRRVFVASMAIFGIGSVVIATSTTFAPFLVGRVLTALGGGAMVPVGLAIVADAYREERRARALGVLGAIETLGWVWGPLYGALIVRFLTWRWQFWLNVPLAIAGIVAAWWALAAHDERRDARIDWVGVATLTTALVSLNVALLGSAEIQSVSGLDELTGGSDAYLRWFFVLAVLASIAFVARQRRADDPLVDFSLFRGRNLTAAIVINFLVGAALVIAMVDVPLFVNVVEIDVERSAVIAGWVLSALTAAMAAASYVGGRYTESTWYRPPVVAGLGLATLAYVVIGFTWDVEISYVWMGAQLALLGVGLGLVIAPTSAAVVDEAPPDRRGTAAGLVVMLRLVGFSVGLSGLTAYGLWRFNQLRGTLELPPIGDPAFQEALERGQAELTTSALAETLLAAGLVVALGLLATLWMRKPVGGPAPPQSIASTQSTAPPPSRPTTEVTDMNQQLSRYLAPILIGLATALLIAVVALVVVAARLGSTAESLTAAEDAIVELSDANVVLRQDLDNLRGGVAIFTDQAQNLTEQLGELAPTIGASLDEAISGLGAFKTATLEFDVAIQQSIPINTEFVLDRVLDVPIQTQLPINESFDTTIIIQGPFGVDIPLDVTVPVDVVVPVDLVVPIAVNESIPIDTAIEVDLEVPIEFPVAGTELATLAESLEAGLISLREVLTSLT
jgi:EmrB/QacA subfamily drug resistance transporter